MSGCIYYIHCKETNKGYVGQHYSPSPEKRWNQHWIAMKCHDFPLYRAFKKYGKDAFTIETLCVVPLEELPQMEEYWAKQLGTYVWDTPGGYNAVWCGEHSRLGITASPETKEKQSESAKKRFEDPEERKKHSEAVSKRWTDPEERKKTSEAGKKRFEDQSERDKVSEGLKKAFASPEVRKRMSEAGKKKVLDPEVETRRKAAVKRAFEDPEKRKRQSEATKKVMKEKWADPEYCKHQSEARKAAWARRKAMKNIGVATESTA